MINYILLVNAQGAVRTARYYKHISAEDRKQLETSVVKTCLSRSKQQMTKNTQIIHLLAMQERLQRREGPSTILDYEDYTLVYRKFGTVVLIAGVTAGENELAVMELFQLFLETLNKLLGKITEVHIMFNLDKVYMVLDEMIINGRIAETCQERILAPIQLMTTAK